MIGSGDKVEIQLFEVWIREVGLHTLITATFLTIDVNLY